MGHLPEAETVTSEETGKTLVLAQVSPPRSHAVVVTQLCDAEHGATGCRDEGTSSIQAKPWSSRQFESGGPLNVDPKFLNSQVQVRHRLGTLRNFS